MAATTHASARTALVPKWYQSLVAMNLRLDEEDSALLRALAEADQVSLHEAVLRAIRRSARDLAHTARVREATAARPPPRCWTGGERYSTGSAGHEQSGTGYRVP